ncbi:hypothetical protein SAMN02745164_00384 [Marinitoga hydrogenitolerans DSM 16785]|uniref:Uncharacterized protein n=1 Tax=Marinitoga hydrogenitolerans (strain DSM 16785 / JCM 12826 / AT1271) TaxID=1122195 RepID=A0A1M4TAP3_MARH1|nr:hypothetical protein [Marinitoga hydrogenitolerans]SHE41599.1 hypothetical protein SAMN02745164_00384 [Marinitoga hydrogenitolerans DSM 16785]
MKKITKTIVILTFLFVILFSSITFGGPLDGTDSTNITQNSAVFTLNSVDLNQ